MRYREAIERLGRARWQGGFDASLLPLHQALYRECEDWIAEAGPDPRHGFIIIIPVADRPRQLEGCLDSLLELCRLYGYGGRGGDGYFSKVQVLLADDSTLPENRQAQRQLAARFDWLGLRSHYFGPGEQQALLDGLEREQAEGLARVIGPLNRDLGHQGASITRNLAYLKLAELCVGADDPLCWFIDSDQTFQVRLDSPAGTRDEYALNYLAELDRLFRDTDVLVATGKVVGDPPVSPAVMAGKLLRDVAGFLDDLASQPAAGPCGFHRATPAGADQADYHDMADLFGFTKDPEAFRYRCPLTGAHDQRDCLRQFAQRIQGFFDGEHPTRGTCYRPEGLPAPARTVYTGNYVLRPQCLNWFIPLAPLKLRMAGPLLGRLLQAELGGRFVTVNLPLLHRRTLAETGQAECRPGVARARQGIDLGGEFERQFYGDLALFTVERLIAQGYPATGLYQERIRDYLEQTARALLWRYQTQQADTLSWLGRVRGALADGGGWWSQESGLEEAKQVLARFCDDLGFNFATDAPGFRLIGDEGHRARRLGAIARALLEYPADRLAWRRLIER